MQKRKYKRVTTPVGVSSYPWLKDPDKQFDKENGIYSCNIFVDKADAKELVDVIEKHYNENLAAQKKLNPQKKIKLGPKGYDVEKDGKVKFKIKMKGKIGDVEVRPVVVDSKGNPLIDAQGERVLVYGGSKVKVSADLVPYYVATTGAGISLRLIGVQVLELQTKPLPSMQSLGFKEEEGYEQISEEKDTDTSNETSSNTSDKEDFI